jgi:hypothetical protein
LPASVLPVLITAWVEPFPFSSFLVNFRLEAIMSTNPEHERPEEAKQPQSAQVQPGQGPAEGGHPLTPGEDIEWEDRMDDLEDERQDLHNEKSD